MPDNEEKAIDKDSAQEANTAIQDKIKAKEKPSALPSDEQRVDDAEMAKAINRMPEPMRQIFLAMTRTTSRGMTYHPLFDKFTPELGSVLVSRAVSNE